MHRWLLTGILLALATASSAQQQLDSVVGFEADWVGNYRTRDDRREAGLGTELTEWLTFSGLLETEFLLDSFKFNQHIPDHVDKALDPAVQAAIDISIAEIFEIELILEYTEDTEDPVMDELIVATDVGEFGVEFGRYFVPFGLFYSHFVNGPILEFGETRRDVVQLDYDLLPGIELAIYAFDGKTRRQGQLDNDIGWGSALDVMLLGGRLNLGLGHISNLAESEQELLRERDNIFQRKVNAWNFYAVYEAVNWDFSFEMIRAHNKFPEFDPQEDKPEAWNLEAAYYPSDNMEIALRYERSREVLEAADARYGIAATWRHRANVSMTLEVLRSDYQQGFFELDDERFVSSSNTVAFWIAFEF